MAVLAFYYETTVCILENRTLKYAGILKTGIFQMEGGLIKWKQNPVVLNLSKSYDLIILYNHDKGNIKQKHVKRNHGNSIRIFKNSETLYGKWYDLILHK